MQKYTLHKQSSARAPLQTDYEGQLNAAQREAVQHGDGYSLVLAGAGSGKTRTLVYRVAWLIEHGVLADRILLLTFTNKAAGEMLRRVSALLKGEVRGMWGGTFHHVANRILRQHAPRLGFTPAFQILDEDDAVRLFKSVLAAAFGDTRSSGVPKADAFFRVLSYARNSMKSIHEAAEEQFSAFLKYETLLEELSETYQARKREMNVLDFDDLLIYCARLLEERAEVREAFARRFQYVLVDEYQDTNRVQARMADYLSSHHHNLLVVGDDAQSIYSFRAADVANILAFTRAHKGARVFRLETNYRSRPEILTLANESIVQNEAGYTKELKSVRSPEKKLPVIASAPDADAQAAYVIEQILTRVDEGIALHDIAVLFRASFQTLELELALTRHDIPYLKRGGLRYFEQAHVKDVLAYLRVCANPHDELAWKRVLTLYEGVGAQTAESVWQRVRGDATQWLEIFSDALAAGAWAARAQRGLQEAYGDLEAVAQSTSSPGVLIETILDRRYRDYAGRLFDDAEDRILDLETLAGFAARYETAQTLLADAALGEGFRGEVRKGSPGEEVDRLMLTTIHQAKGLEWQTVFVIGLTDGHFPHQRALTRPRALEEERRLFYVAITRAKDELLLTYPETSSFSPGFLLGRPSLFVRELPSHVYQRWVIEDGRRDRDAKWEEIELE